MALLVRGKYFYNFVENRRYIRANVFLELPFLIIYSYFLKGKTRFKFDVWSNDVTLANQMESTGRPGMVHISEKTYGFLKNDYLVEDGDDIGGK